MLNMLKDTPFFGKDHEDDFKHINEALKIVDYLNIPNMTIDPVFLRIFPIKLKLKAKYYLKSH